jgi:hypothetical protein
LESSRTLCSGLNVSLNTGGKCGISRILELAYS